MDAHALQSVSAPDFSRPFSSKEDAFGRLTPYHIFQAPEEGEPYAGDTLAEVQSLSTATKQAREKLKVLKARLSVEGDPAKLRAASESCFLETLQIQNEKAIAASIATPAPNQPLTSWQALQQLQAPRQSVQVSVPQAAAPYNPSLSQPLVSGWQQVHPQLQSSQQPSSQSQVASTPAQSGQLGAPQQLARTQPVSQSTQSQGGWVTVQEPPSSTHVKAEQKAEPILQPVKAE